MKNLKKIDAKDVPRNPIMRRIWVGSHLKFRGLSFASLARQEGVSAQSLNNAMQVSSSHLETVIANALGLKVEDLFPERFCENGQRLGFTKPPCRKQKSPSCPMKNKGREYTKAE